MDCKRCTACCRLFLVNLTEEEYRSRRYDTMYDEFFEDFEEAKDALANNLAKKEDGSCVNLENGICSIYGDRPKTCREFSCDRTDGAFPKMVEEIREWRRKQEKKKLHC